MRAEAQLSQAVRRALELIGCWVYSTEAPRSRGPTGSTPGIPDLIVLDAHAPGVLFIELKTPRGRLTASQTEFLARAKASCCECAVARTVEDALALVVERRGT